MVMLARHLKAYAAESRWRCARAREEWLNRVSAQVAHQASKGNLQPVWDSARRLVGSKRRTAGEALVLMDAGGKVITDKSERQESLRQVFLEEFRDVAVWSLTRSTWIDSKFV